MIQLDKQVLPLCLRFPRTQDEQEKEQRQIVLDSPAKLMQALHQI
jgi:hypothetical protein